MVKDKSIGRIVAEAHYIALSKGWHDEEKANSTWLALIHSEVSEALEADRIGDMDNFEEELADICIRVFDLAGLRGIDLEKVILDKMKRNRLRPYKHGKLY